MFRNREEYPSEETLHAGQEVLWVRNAAKKIKSAPLRSPLISWQQITVSDHHGKFGRKNPFFCLAKITRPNISIYQKSVIILFRKIIVIFDLYFILVFVKEKKRIIVTTDGINTFFFFKIFELRYFSFFFIYQDNFFF